VSRLQAHSHAWQRVAQGGEVKLAADMIGIILPSLYHRAKPRASWLDHSQDEAIIVTCGDEPALWCTTHESQVARGDQ
jgi:hypothetical protein